MNHDSRLLVAEEFADFEEVRAKQAAKTIGWGVNVTPRADAGRQQTASDALTSKSFFRRYSQERVFRIYISIHQMCKVILINVVVGFI